MVNNYFIVQMRLHVCVTDELIQTSKYLILPADKLDSKKLLRNNCVGLPLKC